MGGDVAFPSGRCLRGMVDATASDRWDEMALGRAIRYDRPVNFFLFFRDERGLGALNLAARWAACSIESIVHHDNLFDSPADKRPLSCPVVDGNETDPALFADCRNSVAS